MKKFNVILGNPLRPNLLVFLFIIIIAIPSLYLIDFLEPLVQSKILFILITLIWCFIITLIIIFFSTSKIYNKDYITECTVIDDSIHIKNNLINCKLNKDNIRLVYKTSHISNTKYTVKTSLATGYEVTVECNDKKKYRFHSTSVNQGLKFDKTKKRFILDKNIITWEECGLKQLYDEIKYLQEYKNDTI